MNAFSRFLRPKTKRFAVEFRRILEVLYLEGSHKVFGRIFTIYVSENEVVSCEVETYFGSFYLAKDITKVVNTIFPSTNEAVCREVQTDFRSFPRASSIKNIWAYFLDFCVRK